ARSTSASGPPGSPRSQETWSDSPTPGPSGRRPAVTTRAPSSASIRAVSRPMPAVEPVTTHTLSRRPRSIGRLPYPSVTELLLVRHGETDWNREGRWQGQADTPLNDVGRAQARELADALAGERLEAIYASDLRRAYETAEIVGARLGLPVTSEPALRETDVGSWSGLAHDELEGRA